MTVKVGFIGAGNMGFAMIKGIINSKHINAKNVYVFDLDKEKLHVIKNEMKINVANSTEDIVENCDLIILAVKPNLVKSLLTDLKSKFDTNKILISVAVGIPIKTYEDIIGEDKKIIRTMPNLPAVVGEGMTLACCNSKVGEGEFEAVCKMFECMGEVEIIEERLLTEVTALTGSSPAYMFMILEAMADAAVLSGINRKLAYKLAAQAMLGSAKLFKESGLHPGELKDRVCSPSGSTIEAVTALEKNGLRYTIIEAMNRCTDKARDIGSIS